MDAVKSLEYTYGHTINVLVGVFFWILLFKNSVGTHFFVEKVSPAPPCPWLIGVGSSTAS